MKRRIEINGAATPIYEIRLKDILSLIIDGEKYDWKLLWLTATGNPNNNTVLETENKINNSPAGYPFLWSELQQLASSLNQTEEIVIIGDRSKEKLIRYENDEKMRSECSFCIEMIDSSYWSISCDDERTLKNFQENLKGVQVSVV